MAISEERKREQVLSDVNNNGWLHIFYFPTVHARVLQLKPELERLLSIQEEKDSCIVYKTLLSDLHEQGYGADIPTCLRSFSKLLPFQIGNAIMKKARPG